MYINSKCLGCAYYSHTTHIIRLILITFQWGRVCPPHSAGALIPHAGCCSAWCPLHSCWALISHSRLPFHMDALLTLLGPWHSVLVSPPAMQWTPFSPSWALVPSAGCHSLWTLSSPCLSSHPAPDLPYMWTPSHPAHAPHPKPGYSQIWRLFYILGFLIHSAVPSLGS